MANVDVLESQITAVQIREWQAFYNLEPWGAEMDFWRTGIIASTIANVAPNRKQGAKLLTPQDFMPNTDVSDKPNTKALRADIRDTFAGRIIDTKKKE